MAFFVVCVMAFAQEKAQISFNVKKHDFGKLYQNKDSIVSVTFYFENTGNAPLEIQKVSATCGCTVSEWTASPVGNRQKGFVKVIFHSKGITGKFSKSIYVKSNAENDVVILRIEGEVSEKKKSVFNLFS